MRQAINRRDDIVLVDRYMPGKSKIMITDLKHESVRKPEVKHATVISIVAVASFGFSRTEERREWNTSLLFIIRESFLQALRTVVADAVKHRGWSQATIHGEGWASLEPRPNDAEPAYLRAGITVRLPAPSKKALLSLPDALSLIAPRDETMEARLEADFKRSLEKADRHYAEQRHMQALAMAIERMQDTCSDLARERSDYDKRLRLLRDEVEQTAHVILAEFLVDERISAEIREAAKQYLVGRQLVHFGGLVFGGESRSMIMREWLKNQPEE